MNQIDKIMEQLRMLYSVRGLVLFNTPEYIDFHNALLDFIYENYLQTETEWHIISKLLLYDSKQTLSVEGADKIMRCLEDLKRKLLLHYYEPFWRYIDSRIADLVRNNMNANCYSEAVFNAYKEVNNRVKRLYYQTVAFDGKELDGAALMNKAFSPETPVITFNSLSTQTEKDIQRGNMYLFSGAMAAIRNPNAHETIAMKKDEAIKQLVFASFLMLRLDEACSFMGFQEA